MRRRVGVGSCRGPCVLVFGGWGMSARQVVVVFETARRVVTKDTTVQQV